MRQPLIDNRWKILKIPPDMCGRYANSETIPAMRRYFDADGPDVDWSPSWNVCPTRQIPVLLGDRSSRRIGLMRWGWNPDVLKGLLLINCRGEEAHTKRLFQEPLTRRRCVVPATAFYEWQPSAVHKGKPQPFIFAPAQPGLLALGGLWVSTLGADGSKAPSVILMTVPANSVVSPVHDRMPLVIEPNRITDWLDIDTGTDVIHSMIAPSPAAVWTSWAISRAISDVKRDGPDIQATANHHG